MKIAKVNYKIKGVYEWGVGYKSNDLIVKWNKFFKEEFGKKDYIYWERFQGEWDVWVLVDSTSGNCYLHPMSGEFCLFERDYSCSNFGNIEKFEEILKDLCAYMGEGVSYTLEKQITKIDL